MPCYRPGKTSRVYSGTGTPKHLWIENGALTHAVEEITIAGNLREMFKNVTAIGSDLVFRGSVASPTLRIDGMTIAGA